MFAGTLAVLSSQQVADCFTECASLNIIVLRKSAIWWRMDEKYVGSVSQKGQIKFIK